MADTPDEPPIAFPIGDTLDLHTFRPNEVGALVPDWLQACREAGHHELRLIHGKGTGALRAGVVALLERSPLVRALHADGNWGGVGITVWPSDTDEPRVRAILEASPRFGALLDAVAAVGPAGAWIGAGAVRNRVWHALHRRAGEPEETDTDVAWHGAGSPDEDARYTATLTGALPARWEVVDQARCGAASAEAGIAGWPETATCVAARRRAGPGSELELYAAYGWADVVGMLVRANPARPAEAFTARLAKKRWRARFPWVRVERP